MIASFCAQRAVGADSETAAEGEANKQDLRGIGKKEALFVSASDLSDESLLRYYDSIREAVEAERRNKHKFMTSDSIKEYAESLRVELHKRRLSHAPIDWWANQQTDTVTPRKSDASELLSFANEATATETAEEITRKTSER
jgi:DNA phosphorothioation-dependent restriction protein DptG